MLSRSANDKLLRTFVLVMCAVLVYLSYTNYKVNASSNLFWGTVIAFLFAFIVIGADLQETVKSHFTGLGAKGRANTLIIETWQGWATMIAWGAFAAAMFHVVHSHPDWAKETFQFKVADNPEMTGLMIGISALIIIRSKLIKANNIDWGFEGIYLWSSQHVCESVYLKRTATKNLWEGKFRPIANDIASCGTFFTDLEREVLKCIGGKPQGFQPEPKAEIAQIRATFIPSADPNPDQTINASAPARRMLVSVTLDYLGQGELVSSAKDAGITI